MMSLRRRHALVAASATTLLSACAGMNTTPHGGARRHYVLVHGAWHGAWAWRRLAPLLRQAGHTVSTPTLSGLGERAHHAPGRSGLDVHVQDVLSHLQMEDLRQVVLVGHSYAGCVVSGVLAARQGRVAHAIYLDAFVPTNGQGLASFVPPVVKADYEKLAAAEGLVPPPPPASWGERWGVTDPALLAWAQERITPQAALSFTQGVQGDPFADAAVRLSYLKCAQNPNPGFKNVAATVQKNPRFRYAEVDGHHNVMLVHPERLAVALLALG
jgi:pimeloyl-ACP methyl ester carboxylesterase